MPRSPCDKRDAHRKQRADVEDVDAGRIRAHKRKSVFQTVMSAGRWHYHCRCGERRLRYVAVFWAALGASRGLASIYFTWGAGRNVQ
jgi:hypothetical protein